MHRVIAKEPWWFRPGFQIDRRVLTWLCYYTVFIYFQEAYFRLGQTLLAQAALKDAIVSSIKDVTGTTDDMYATTASATVTLENIITQKYIALFTTAEPYSDWRRTGFPNLTPNQESQTKKIPVRLITPKSERTLNANATVVSSMYTPVWWAK